MHKTELEKLNRKELQALAKTHGIKANISNNDIIAKLCDVEVPTESTPAEVANDAIEQEVAPTKVEPIVVEETVVVEETAPVVEEKVMETIQEVASESSVEHIPSVGDEVEAIVDDCWVNASVKRLNKKTARVVVTGSGKEFTLKFTELRPIMNATTTSSPAEIESVADSTNNEVVEQMSKEPASEPVMDVVMAEEEIISEPVEIVQQSETMEVVEAPAEEIAVEEAAVETIQETAVEMNEPVLLAAPAPTPLSIIRVDYLEPLSCPRAPPTPQSCARPSVGWNSCTRFSLEDSAVKSAGGPSSKRKERRKARRSAMKQLAESMKLEGMESSDSAETEEETTNNEAQVAITSTPLVVPTPVPAAAAPASVNAASKDMLPRMNKAQLMRIGAIQKKIVTTELAPPTSTAFTIAAKPASSSATPSHARQSISAPSSVAGSARPAHSASASSSVARPSLKVATPLSGATNKNALSSRASIAGGSVQQTSGLKRKLDSSDRSSSVHSNAPDFKRMHSKQFNSLKSITECVEQDKHVGVRMTIAMESAMTTNTATTSSASTSKPPTTSTNPSHRLSTIAEVAKPAANPFNKVLGISKGSTPGKAAATPAPLALSRPTTGINTSANIVKSRTVTSFVSSTCASGGAGGQKVTSFLNNENEKPSGNSFLKSKDLGSGSAKHRSVSMSGSNFGHTQQKLQML